MDNTEVQSLKRIAEGGGIIFIGMLLSKIISYFYRLVIARFFGPSVYGTISIGLAVVGIAGMIALLGLGYGVTRYVAYYMAKDDKRSTRGVLLTSIKMVSVASVLLTISLLMLSEFFAGTVFGERGLFIALVIMSFSIPFTALTGIYSAAFRGFQRVKYIVYSENIFINIAKLIGVIIVGLSGMGVEGIALSWTLASVFTFLFSFYLLEKKVFPVLKSETKPKYLNRELLLYSLPLLVTGFISYVTGWTDTLMLGYFATSETVGIYNAALPTSQLILSIPIMFNTLFLPVVTVLYARKKVKEIRDINKVVAKWIFCITFPFFLLVAMFPGSILGILFGPTYVSGYLTLVILSAGYMFFSVVYPSANILMATGKTKFILFNLIIVASANVVLNYFLIPVYGISGAAFATASSFTIDGILLSAENWKFSRITAFSRKLAKPLLAAAISAVVIYQAYGMIGPLPEYLMIALFTVFLAMYAALFIIFRGVEREDIEVLKAVERRAGVQFGFLRKIMGRLSR